MPERQPGKPHLYVGITVETPEQRFERLTEGKVRSIFDGHYKALRPDLNPEHGKPLTVAEARDKLGIEKQRLARLGYAINGINTSWNCYVVDLEPPAGMTNIGEGYVYVGQSQLTPEKRFEVHKGPRPAPPKKDIRSRLVHNRGIRPNLELMKMLRPSGPFFTQGDALSAEKEWARSLDERGFRVQAGDATPRPRQQAT
jgi:hypothetical protein